MGNLSPHVYAFLLAFVAIAGIIVLAALKIAIPTILTEVTVATLSGGFGLAIPSGKAAPPPA